MPKLIDAAEQRRQIREAARAVFARQGLRGTGLAHVARAAGMGRSSLYHYYPDKDALLRDLVVETLADERDLFRSCLGGPGTSLERILRLVDALAALFDAWAVLGRLLLELRLDDVQPFRRFFREVRDELAGVVREGQATGEIDASLDAGLAAATLIGAVDGLLFQHFLDPRALDPGGLGQALRGTVTKVLSP
jgi:TetR/AcrR family fatty acid metabolism transcriptional regulator